MKRNLYPVLAPTLLSFLRVNYARNLLSMSATCCLALTLDSLRGGTALSSPRRASQKTKGTRNIGINSTNRPPSSSAALDRSGERRNGSCNL